MWHTVLPAGFGDQRSHEHALRPLPRPHGWRRHGHPSKKVGNSTITSDELLQWACDWPEVAAQTSSALEWLRSVCIKSVVQQCSRASEDLKELKSRLEQTEPDMDGCNMPSRRCDDSTSFTPPPQGQAPVQWRLICIFRILRSGYTKVSAEVCTGVEDGYSDATNSLLVYGRHLTTTDVGLS